MGTRLPARGEISLACDNGPELRDDNIEALHPRNRMRALFMASVAVLTPGGWKIPHPLPPNRLTASHSRVVAHLARATEFEPPCIALQAAIHRDLPTSCVHGEGPIGQPRRRDVRHLLGTGNLTGRVFSFA